MSERPRFVPFLTQLRYPQLLISVARSILLFLPPTQKDLPSSPTLIIEALAENSATSPPNHTLLDKALIDYTRCAPTLSIDTLSYLNYDTGTLLVQFQQERKITLELMVLDELPFCLLQVNR
jgi:hypothetical protein